MFKHLMAGVAIVAATSGVPAGVQAQAPRAQQDEAVQARYNIFVMEGVLERAVEHGADRLRRQVRRVMPDMLMLSGQAEARGFRLEGYGVFFDVEVPVMRRSIAWSLRTIIDDNTVTNAVLQQLKTAIEQNTPDPREKAALLQTVKRIEVQFAQPHVAPGQQAAATAQRAGDRNSVQAMDNMATPQQVAPILTQEDRTLLEDQDGAYEREIINALMDAMLDHSGPTRVGPDEWLTVAARDNEHRDRLVPGDPYDLLTIVLRIKGSDLAAFRADRITRDEARKRVEVREF